MRRIWSGAVVACIGFLVVPAGPAHAATTCGGQPATITGTGGNDVITGTRRDDVIVTGAGDDTVFASGGNDIVCGGSGADYLRGEDGADRLHGGVGDDLLVGGPGDDTVTGADGDDAMHADGTVDGVDTYHGSAGFDRIDYSSRGVGLTVRLSDSGSDPGNEDVIGVDMEWIVGSHADDTLVISATAGNRVEGGTGEDTIDVSDGISGNDFVAGNYLVDRCRADDGDIIHSCP
jgi:Ca2+-binding RTX toxin-like protein